MTYDRQGNIYGTRIYSLKASAERVAPDIATRLFFGNDVILNNFKALQILEISMI